jgi:serine/threonine protein kinase
LLDSFKDKKGGGNLVLENAEGGTLHSWVYSHDSGMPQDVIIRIMRDLARGLMQIHGQRVSHRDIKSKNLLLMGDTLMCDIETPLVKYADFGISWVGNEDFERDVSDTFKLIQQVAKKAFNEKQVSEFIVKKRFMTAKGLLEMVELLEDALAN